MERIMREHEHVCGCGDGVCACAGACGCEHHPKLTVVAVGTCPACAKGILEAESDQSSSVCNACGFIEPPKL